MALDPQALLRKARSGDKGSLGRLLESYSTYLMLLVRMQIGKQLQGKVDAGDVIQETFLEAHRQFSRFRGTTEPELTAWLRKILAGECALVQRRFLGTKARDVMVERKLEEQIDQSSAILDRGLIANRSSPSQQASRREQGVLLSEGLARLSADYREVIILRHLEGLPFSEVAQRMGRSEDSVQKLWVRALASMRRTMGEKS